MEQGKKWNKKVNRNKKKKKCFRVDRTIVEVLIIVITLVNSTSVHEKSVALLNTLRLTKILKPSASTH